MNDITKDEIIAIAIKYHRKSNQERRYGEAKCAFFDQIADNIEDNYYEFEENDNFETEEDVVEFVKESIRSFGDFYADEDMENMDMFDELPDDEDYVDDEGDEEDD